MTRQLQAIAIIFFVIALGISTYPPAKYGAKELARIESGNGEFRHKTYINGAREYLPISGRMFLFDPATRKELVGWGWDNTKAVSIPYWVQARPEIDTQRIVIEYIVALCVAVIASFLYRK
jgi:hypothetical protein